MTNRVTLISMASKKRSSRSSRKPRSSHGEALRNVSAARETLVELISQQAMGMISLQDVADSLPELLTLLKHAEGALRNAR